VGRPIPSVSLSGFDGAPVNVGPGERLVLFFFRDGCVSCPDELAGLAAVAASTAGRVRCVGVSLDDDQEAARALVAAAVSEGLVDAAWDADRALAASVAVSVAPATMIVDASGTIVADWREPVGMRALHRAVRENLL
jgi:peroxiredoxin